ncbi:class I SAM-dependent methyltransferase [Vibrio scophthalmi]|uniref:S-adenosyl-L-methionine-dependent methyltransferase n=1 Tax=Vibrio scophthalmi TaxID=45658 RepID=A0A1E3WFQ8_9VIBR|nr:SAM-dependent methyltransferase [Vibrio scophthalmi]ODS04606.1 putative S-adenosyl-L-methionine-dependent methyltransferase [Vibrio scophthalmi]
MSRSIFVKDGTAQGVAKQRLIETLAKDDKRIINDPYAERFVIGAPVIKLLGHKVSLWITKKFMPGFHEHLISRTRFIDDLIKESASEGFEQYVILGAGYDSRPYRLDLPSTMRIFEVDQLEVQARKRSKLTNNVASTSNVTYVDVDFNHQSLTEQLLATSFDKTKRTIFTLEGVSQYISKEALALTIEELSKLTQGTKSTFFISYVSDLIGSDPQACFGEGYPRAVERADTIQRLSAKAGEPWISFYSSDEIGTLLCRNGFILKENRTLADLNDIYFSPVGRAIPEKQIFKLEHFVVAKS